MACFRITWSGVDLFFVLSGFLLGGILIDNRDSANFWRVFYSRRTLRIFPLYFFVLASFAILLAAAPNLPWLLSDPLPILSYATFTQNFVMGFESKFGSNYMGVTWSLAVEEQFYLFLPFIIRFTAPRLLPWVLAGLIVASPILRAMIFHYFSTHHFLSVYVLTICRADALFLGVMCAWLYRFHGQFLARNILGLRLLLAALLISLILLSISGGSPYSRSMIFGGYTLVGLLYSVILLTSIVQRTGFVVRITTSEPLTKLGTIAFGIYLTHQIVLGLTHGVLLGQSPALKSTADVLVTIGALAGTILISWLSFHYFERRFIILGHKVAYSKNS